ncbi:hypothetical protein LZ32DRAFT_226438 [Colletotrichum eremochloae]|nr:hypothetical protein LZ32DRAFT_226438 [Colletotrichum eremochloae]
MLEAAFEPQPQGLSPISNTGGRSPRPTSWYLSTSEDEMADICRDEDCSSVEGDEPLHACTAFSLEGGEECIDRIEEERLATEVICETWVHLAHTRARNPGSGTAHCPFQRSDEDFVDMLFLFLFSILRAKFSLSQAVSDSVSRRRSCRRPSREGPSLYTYQLMQFTLDMESP